METKKIKIELIKQESSFYVLELHTPGAVPLLSREMPLEGAEKTANLYRKACGLLQKYQVVVRLTKDADVLSYNVEAENFVGALKEVEKICDKDKDYNTNLVNCIQIKLA